MKGFAENCLPEKKNLSSVCAGTRSVGGLSYSENMGLCTSCL